MAQPVVRSNSSVRPLLRAVACGICFGIAGLVWSLPRLRVRRLRRAAMCHICAACSSRGCPGRNGRGPLEHQWVRDRGRAAVRQVWAKHLTKPGLRSRNSGFTSRGMWISGLSPTSWRAPWPSPPPTLWKTHSFPGHATTLSATQACYGADTRLRRTIGKPLNARDCGHCRAGSDHLTVTGAVGCPGIPRRPRAAHGPCFRRLSCPHTWLEPQSGRTYPGVPASTPPSRGSYIPLPTALLE